MGVVAISMLPVWTDQHLESWFRMKYRVSVKTIKKLVTMRDKFERQLKDTTIRLQLLCQCAANTNCYSLRRLKTFGLAMAYSFLKFKFILYKKKSIRSPSLQPSPIPVEFQIYNFVTSNFYCKANVTWDETTALNTWIQVITLWCYFLSTNVFKANHKSDSNLLKTVSIIIQLQRLQWTYLFPAKREKSHR